MKSLAQILCFWIVSLAAPIAFGGPVEEASVVVDHWSAAYTSNDPEAVVRDYAPDAILLGTVSSVMSVGTEAIRQYFSRLKGTGNKNTLGDKRTIFVSDNAVLVTGFYEFSGMQDGKLTARPSSFTMPVTKRDGEWLIAHHHLSPHVQPAK
ncbi:MAG: SgcJ/EcaC family oxidoreductase [Betaproteobacteria bacterium]|nr:SgcJ/EcaC family oxidoreductase [Betaproteobacteria bacterium]